MEHGKIQARKFSWDESSRRAIAVFEQLHTRESRNTETALDNEQICTSLITKLAERASKDTLHADADLMTCALSIAQNLPTKARSRQLLVDISELVQRDARTGVQRVTRSMLRELLLSRPGGYSVEPVYATTERPGYRYARAFTRKFRGQNPDEREDDPIETQPGDVFLGLDLQAHVVVAQKQQLEMMYRSGIKIYFLVHDLLPITTPQYFGPGTAEAHINWLHTISRFDGIVCVSRTVAEEVASWLSRNGQARMRPLKIGWSHNGADVANSVPTLGLPRDATVVLTNLAARPTFLIVGTIEPRKGHVQALAAFEQLWKERVDVNLVIVGKQGWKVDELVGKLRVHPELGKRLHWLEGISDEYLEKIYASSTCLIAASEGEGFGLPLIEAAQHKLPIMARDIPVFREVAGEHAYYFKGIEPYVLAATIKDWLALRAKGRAPSSDSMPWLTWAQSTQQLLRQILPADCTMVKSNEEYGHHRNAEEVIARNEEEHGDQSSAVETSL
jgi:glycosyltransferase involved in cell wall biosynthesis